MSRNVTKTILSGLLVLLLLTAAGCGSQQQVESDASLSDQEATDSATEAAGTAEEMVYVPEYIPLELETDEDLYLANFFGSSLYYVSRQYGDTPEDTQRFVCEYSLTEKREVRRILVGEGMGEIEDFRALDDGSIYVLDYADRGGSDGDSVHWLMVYDEQGVEQLAVNLWDEAGIRASTQAPAVDAQGRIYLPNHDEVVLLTSEGVKDGVIPLQNGEIDAIGMGCDNKIYITTRLGVDQERLSEVCYEEKTLGKSYENYPVNRQGLLVTAKDGCFLVNTGAYEIVYRYNPETQSPMALFSWMDCDISGRSVIAMGPETEDGIWAVFYGGETEGQELVCLKQREVSSLPVKTELVIGSVNASSELKDSIAAFNRHSTDCRVTLREYSGQYAWTWEDGYADAITAMNIDLVSAHKCPDLLDLASLNVKAYARNGVFEDLGPWLDKSETLHREDYVENILNNYTYDGKLVSIPASVTLNTLAGKATQVGAAPGWTLEELIACANAQPEVPLTSWCNNQIVLRLCMRLGKSSFIDWTEGECYFDSDMFRQLLLFAASYPDEPTDIDGSYCEQIRSDKVLLTELTINVFQDIQLYEAVYEEEMTFIGYPTEDGEGSGCYLSTLNAYAVTSRSENKEMAWEFIEYALNRDVENSLPTNRVKLLEKATAEEYIGNEWGQYFLRDGMPLPKYDTINFNGMEYTYHEVTEEEKATLLYMMDTAQCVNAADEILWRIIIGEAVPFFQGQRTAEEAAALIQSRINLYLKENQ